MEYRLNKIDTDLRQKINDAAKEGKVHGTKNVAINRDKKEEKKEKKDHKLERYSKSKKLLVDVVKTENIEIDAFKEKTDIQERIIGSYIDIKK